jgi:hypothetical protein
MKHRWTGQPEIWLNDKTGLIVLRDREYSFEYLDLKKPGKYLKYGVFKTPWTFDFYNGSAYLQKHGFKLMERVTLCK